MCSSDQKTKRSFDQSMQDAIGDKLGVPASIQSAEQRHLPARARPRVAAVDE
jgi:hypothetical protein